MTRRIRSIKPDVLDDERATALSDSAWRLWVSLWLVADNFGCARFGDRYLAANVWQDTTKDVAAYRQELIDRGFVTPYAVNGQRYAEIRGWAKHQRIDNVGKRDVPAPEEDDGTWDQTLTANLADLSAGGEGKGREGKGREGNASAPPSLSLAPTDGEKKISKAKRAKASASRIDPSWVPSEKVIAEIQADGIDAMAVLPEFIDYWLADATPKAIKANWDAAFRNRIRDLKTWGRAPAWSPSRQSGIMRTATPGLLDVLPEPAPKTIAPEPEAPEAETLDEMLGDGDGWNLGGRVAS